MFVNLKHADLYYKRILQVCNPPLGLLYLSSSLLKQGYQVKIIDANAFGLTNSQVSQEAASYSPHLIGIPVLSETTHQAYELVKDLKRVCPFARFVLGGQGVTAQPREILEEFEDADFVLKGECEKTIIDLCQVLENNGTLEEIQGLCYRKNGEIICDDSTPCFENLNDLELPAKILLQEAYLKKRYYNVLVKERPLDALITSRGCPYLCKFCHNVDHTYRTVSAERVMDEIYEIFSRGIRYIRIADDNFTLDRDRAMRIFSLIEKEKLNINIELKSRVTSVDKELIEKAKKVGVCQIIYGCESGVQDILDRMQKGITLENIVNACRLAKEAGIRHHTGWLFGFPGETPETINKTVDFIIRLRPTSANFTILKPYPKTAVYEQAKAEDTLIGDWDAKNPYVPWVKLPWTKSRSELEEYIKRARLKLYFRKYYIYNFSTIIFKDLNTTMAKYALQEVAYNIRR